MLTLYIADVERDAGMKKLSREEAAKVLKGMKVKFEIPKAAVTQWERNAALDMAIEVLNCSEIPNKSDTISRQAAIDKLKDRLIETALNSVGIRENVDETLIDVADERIERWIDEVPSAQSEIIRCKDCKHRDKYGCCKYWKGLAMGDIPIATDDYDFCSYAKRI